jgi:hypothetical protein
MQYLALISSRRIQKLFISKSDGLGLIQQLMEKLEEEEFIEAITMARMLWLRRNTYVFDGVFTAPTQLIIQAKE